MATSPICVEPLERRQLLTFFGGDSFEFRQSLAGGGSGDSVGGEVIRAKFEGNITVELIGAQVNRMTNEIQLVNLPGELTRDGTLTDIGGGLNPAIGIDEIGPIFTIGDNNPNFSAIAANGLGTFYGFSNRAPFAGPGGAQGTAVQIYQLTLPTPAAGQINGTTVGTPIATIFAANGANNPALPITVTGADIAPNGDLFFAATTFNGAVGLFSVRPSVFVPGDPDEVAASLTFFGNILPPGSAAGDPPTTVSTIAFVNGTLLGVVNNGDDDSDLITINPADGSITNTVPITVADDAGAAGEGVGNIVGLDVSDDGTLIAIQGGEDASVFAVDEGTGISINLGPLGTEVATGLTFIPGVTDPFSGASGAFIGVGSNDTLFFVNIQDRNVAQFLWNVYVTASDITGKIVIGYVRDLDDDPPDPYVIRPFEDSIGDIRTLNAQDGTPRMVTAPDNTGMALIGALSQDIPDVDDEDLIPFPAQTLPSGIDFGTVPADVLGSTLSPGLVVEDGQDLGSFMLGGTILGKVDARANLDFFYAGWVLTGQLGDGTIGLGQMEGPPEVEDNFNVGGDLRSLISLGAIGSDGVGLDDPLLLSGFDLRVGGTVGTVRSYDAFYGHAEVNHFNNAPRIGRNQRESEFHDPALENGFEEFNFGPSGGATFMYNDTYESAEYIGSIASAVLGRAEVIRVEGVLQKSPDLLDNADYYAVGLMAGQQVTVRVRENLEDGTEDPSGGSAIALGVFDPDARLMATDYNNVRPAETRQQYFTFKADRPGIYRFAIASVGDAPEFGTEFGVLAITPYTLTILGVGDIALGGIVAQSTVYDLPSTTNNPAGGGIEVFRGDLGAVRSIAGDLLTDSGTTVDVEVGNLRALDAVNIGGPNIDVPEGSVGHVRANGGTALSLSAVRAIGGDFQLIDGPLASVFVDIRANKGVGVIRGFDMATIFPSVITVNADDTGEDGVIDLIDVTGDFGLFGPGGPQITTNTGGNVRYIRVGGNVFRDRFFGGNEGDVLIMNPGESRTVVDDSGAVLRFTASGQVTRNAFFDPQFPQAGISEFLGPQMTLLTYGIRGSGGSVVIDATSDSGMSVDVSNGRSAEIGRVEIRGIGPEVVSGVLASNGTILRGDTVRDSTSPTGSRTNYLLDRGVRATTPTQTPTDPNAPTTANAPRRSPDDLFLRVSGDGIVDILNVVVTDTGSDTGSDDNMNSTALDVDGAVAYAIPGDFLTELGNALSIVNSTGGEIVNVAAESVGELVSRGNLGFGRSTTGTAVEGVSNLTVGDTLGPRDEATPRPVRGPGVDLAITQPLLGIREGITIGGGIVMSMRAGKAIGNVAVIDGSIGEVVANADGEDDPSQFEGINGTIYVDFIDEPDDILFLPGRIERVRIGEGILPTGTGNFAQAGIIVGAIVGPITGTNADIRGDIIANNRYRLQVTLTVTDPNGTMRQVLSPSNTPIESVSLVDGVIANADIRVPTDPGDYREFVGVALLDFEDEATRPEFEILRVSTRGKGGIIGSFINAADIGEVSATDESFGIIGSIIRVLGNGTLNRIEASGYGIRDVTGEGGFYGELVANGDGTSMSTNAVNPRVRASELPVLDAVTGVIDPLTNTIPNRLTDIHEFLGTNATQPEISGVTDTGIISAVVAAGQRSLRAVRAWQIRDGTVLDFADSVGTLDVRDIINGLELTTGTLKKFSLAQDAFALTVNVSGRVKNIDIRGSLANNSVIRTRGDGGKIDNVKVLGNFIGNIDSSRSIKSIQIGGDFTGNISVNSGGTAIKTLRVGGAFVGGSLDIVGNVGTIQSSGSLGSLGDTLTVNGNLGKLLVGGDLRANVRVTGGLKLLQVRGSIVDGGIEDGLLVDVSQTLNSLQVGGDIQSGVQINAKSIKKTKIGGQNLGEINIVA